MVEEILLNLTVEDVLLNTSYIIYVVALLVSEILWLRTILVIAQVCMISYGFVDNNLTMVGWNSLFLTVNVVQVIRIMLARRAVHIPPDLKYFHDRVFNNMDARNFLYFWNTGQRCRTVDGPLSFRGEVMAELILIVEGTVSVKSHGKEVARLHRGNFVAEMSFISGRPASANVLAKGEVKFMSWSKIKLDQLRELNPALMLRLQETLGKDLTAKLLRSTEPLPTAD